MKSLLDVADNLERAAGSITDQSLQGLGCDGKPLSAEQSSKLLNGLLEGVHLTDRLLVQVLSPEAQIFMFAVGFLKQLSCNHGLDSQTNFGLQSSLISLYVQALKQNGVEKFSPLGQKFDPNLHSALFQIPDAEKDAGTVVVVTKVSLLEGQHHHSLR